MDSSESSYISSCIISASLRLIGEPPSGEWLFLVIYNGQVVLNERWVDDLSLDIKELPIFKDKDDQELISDNPLLFIMRTIGAKGPKEIDPVQNLDNRYGAAVDLLPLVLGEERVYTNVPLVSIATGENVDFNVIVDATCSGQYDVDNKVPLIITLYSAHCLPYSKDGTTFICSIGLDQVLESVSVNFGMSNSSSEAKKVLWASASNGGYAANTAINIPKHDMFVPDDLCIQTSDNCRSTYWYAMKRIFIDPMLLRDRLSAPFYIEIAGVPKVGKVEVRGRYVAFADAGVMMQPGRCSVTMAAKLIYYSETNLPENIGPLLDLPPTSAKASVRDVGDVKDEFNHDGFVIIRFDLQDPLYPTVKIASLYDEIGFPLPEGSAGPVNELILEPSPENSSIDARRIRKEGGALAVHNELSGLACRGAVEMNQSIKRTAANKLLMRVRSMLKQFSSGDCSSIDWQETVTGQHAACRRAVTASFAPQSPPLRVPARSNAARSRMAGDVHISQKNIETGLSASPNNPRILLSAALRCLETRNDSAANNFILRALASQVRNRYLLWIFGGQKFDKGPAEIDKAAAAFRLAVKGEYTDGTANAIGWAALHGLQHFRGNSYAAFVAAQKMRKFYELPREWKEFLKRWFETSGEEEVYWIPSSIDSENPILIAAAFFLCLRCYNFSEVLLQCVKNGCVDRGSRVKYITKTTPDIYYLKSSCLLLKKQFVKALEVADEGIRRFGPLAIMLQIRASCLSCIGGWDDDCIVAMKYTEMSGADLTPNLLLKSALGDLKSDPKTALQRAARAHKIAPSAHTALLIGRIYAELTEYATAMRWAAVSVKIEAFYADGWALLAFLAIRDKEPNKARAMLRTAKQVGRISSDLEKEVKEAMGIIEIEDLSDALIDDLCLCDYH